MVSENLIEKDFHHAMIGIYEKASDACNYRPTRFLQLVQEHGGLETAKRLLSRNEPQAGLGTLWECGRLDLSMEALVLQPRFQELFTDAELEAARERLRAYGYNNLDS